MNLALEIIETTWTIEGDPGEVWIWGDPATLWTWGQADYLSRLGLLRPCEIIPSLEADQ
ncbi:hypothetical protein MCEMIH16_01352 [Caulobacteraceae bacterium]